MDSIINEAKEKKKSQSNNKNDETEIEGMSEETSEEDLETITHQIKTNISVVGCGGAGNNTIDRIYEEGINGADLVSINTDAQDLKENRADRKILIGEEICRGRGAGSVPSRGEECARQDEDMIRDVVKGQDMVFITAGMGGGTGTGAAPVVAEIASEEALTISVVTMPFVAEGKSRRDNAEGGLEKLRKYSDTVIVVPNERLRDHYPNLNIQRAFRVADEVLMRSVRGITNLITESSLINLDFADVKTVMSGGGVAMIGLGEADISKSQESASDSVHAALNSPLIDVNIENASSALINVSGDPEMDVDQAQTVVEVVNEKISEESRIIWGTNTDEELEGKIRTMVIMTGVESPQIFGPNEDRSTKNVVEDDNNDIDFVG